MPGYLVYSETSQVSRIDQPHRRLAAGLDSATQRACHFGVDQVRCMELLLAQGVACRTLREQCRKRR